MSPRHRRYLAKEAGIAAAINGALSIAFVFLVFGGRASVSVAGQQGLILDALLQGFMVAAMSTLVPTLLTRRKTAVDSTLRLQARVGLPRSVIVRTLAVGIVAGVLSLGAHAALLPLGAPAWAFGTVLVYKAVLGALLGAAIAWSAARIALGDEAAGAA